MKKQQFLYTFFFQQVITWDILGWSGPAPTHSRTVRPMKRPLEKPEVFPGVAVGNKPTVAVPTAPEDGQLLLRNLFWGLTI